MSPSTISATSTAIERESAFDVCARQLREREAALERREAALVVRERATAQLVQEVAAAIDRAIVPALRSDQAAGLAALNDPTEWLTVAEAADLAGVSCQSIRNWCARFGIGDLDASGRSWTVSRRRLRAHMLQRFGKVPHRLKE